MNWRTLIKWSLFVIVLALVVYAMARQFRLIDWTTVEFRLSPIIGALAALVMVYLVQLVSYRMLLGAYTSPPSWRAMCSVAWVPPMGRYIPGKFASVVGAVYLLRRFGVAAPIGLSVVLVMDGIAVITGLMIGSPLLFWRPIREMTGEYAWVASVVVILTGCVLLHPSVFVRVVNLVLKRVGRSPLERIPRASQYVIPILCGFGQWVLAGVALWLMVRSVNPIEWRYVPLCISIAGLAYTISYLLLFAPGGIGPRELIFQTALVLLVGPSATIAVVGMRIVQMLVEVLMAGIGWMMLERTPALEANAVQENAR
jgi:hypothetical protein